ncbi:glycosyltransferase family 90 protein [Neolentinus lepideus HHB14362 ss-1]|uniref:Glycosyltransferase family 90 protein n=1 Tax=Neolentinus lepideus HHB14362 ss-1 TaxID=1314782 RepID=A0A165RXM4_9AGAM|nr:glycosyltransferase family 90 protein [Neolentinus lepideus HHB14362 ss-1]
MTFYLRKPRKRLVALPLVVLALCWATYNQFGASQRTLRPIAFEEEYNDSAPVIKKPGMYAVQRQSDLHPHPTAQVVLKHEQGPFFDTNSVPDEANEKVVAKPEDLFPELLGLTEEPEYDGLEEELPPHVYRSDGLLVVNPEGAHPIYELIERAEEAWDNKLRRASRTLGQAVEEYKRRYRRLPPKGFDHWWRYVQDHNVQLPDEYDQIYHDLEPFWGMDPKDLQKIEKDWEEHKDGFVIGKMAQDDPIDVLKTSFLQENKRENHLKGGYDIIAMLKEVEQFIPPFRAIFSPHDNPNVVKNYELRRMAVEAAAEGKYIDVNHPPPAGAYGWLGACSPQSPARRYPSRMINDRRAVDRKTFIYDHRKTMDPCQHPSHFSQHGQFISHNLGPAPDPFIRPQFSWCVDDLHNDLRVPTPHNWVNDINDPAWDDKTDERLLWRGSNTGIWHGSDRKWWKAHRERLIELTTGRDGTVKVLMPNKYDWYGNTSVGEGVEVKRSALNGATMDVYFAGKPLACESAICEILRELFEWRPNMNWQEAGKYKYVMDIDGNGWSSRFKRLITSRSLIFKSTIYSEWFQDRIQPWVHYVPIQVDLSDLYDTFVFFRGDLDGEGGHDELARRIAEAGRDWSKQFWRKEDLTAYMFRMALEYARVTSLDREEMTYFPPTDFVADIPETDEEYEDSPLW